MNQSKLRKFIILSLLFIEILFMILSVKSFSNRNIKEIKEKYEVDKKTFSMYVENDNGKYSEYISSNMFPEGYQINLAKSSCIDTKGNALSGILSGSKNNVTVISNKTAYCYIYFDIDRTATEEILATVSSEQLWDSTLEDDGYRYVGTNPDNYICFGTNNQEECMNDTDKYMYRIIGIFEDSEGNQHLKLIKKEALNTAYAWHSDYTTDTDWQDSDLYKGINGSYFATNSEYSYMQDSAWNNLITTWDYTATNTKTYENSGLDYHDNVIVQNIYLHETNRSSKTSTVGIWKTVSNKIGLMYASDYLLSLGSSVLEYKSYDNRETLKTGWMHISNNDSGAPLQYEWTMTRYGDVGGWFDSWFVHLNGYIDYGGAIDSSSIRPVFYLESDIKLDKGRGTIDNPYTIEISPNLREYCEEYNNINECIQNEENNIEKVSDLWNSTLEDDGIRFVGTNPNNYVCFGTTNQEECTSDTDKYMYRIIGIFEDASGNNHLKLIKKESLNETYVWHNVANSNADWDESDLYKGLNGISGGYYSNLFVGNSTYNYMSTSSEWYNKVENWEYTATNTFSYDNYQINGVFGLKYYYNSIKTIYLHELNRNGKSSQTCNYDSFEVANCNVGKWKLVSDKIGIMYASDYLLSLGSKALEFINNNAEHYGIMKNGWMYIGNNDSGTPSSYEWSMSRGGMSPDGTANAWGVYWDGFVNSARVNVSNRSIRPVFYLKENIKIKSGKGSITEPFIIS